ncbi:MAG: hypothetical protein GX194_14335, partial [Clostridium sp.]|nr:hypothetical protein [Clostridium sp.]
MLKKLFMKIMIVITALLVFSLLTVVVLVKTPLKNTQLGKATKSFVKSAINNTKSLIAAATRPSLKDNEMILTSPGEGVIQLYSLLPDKSLLITQFNKKEWGTWNIEGWFVSTDGFIPSSSQNLMVGGGSDWEYVFRVRKSLENNYVFSGGNHGLEKMKSFKLINPMDNSEINLEKGKMIRLEKLQIEEETDLSFDDTSNSKYANVKRIYSISPNKITLKTDFEFTSDIFMGTSYVCMLPTSKNYGRYALFKESGNIYTTPSEGETYTTNGFENFLGKEASTTVEVWGDAKPSYKFITSIRDSEMVDNFT